MDKKIAIIGPYPPPIGGISIHIQRVLNHLKNEDFIFFNESHTTSNLQNEIMVPGVKRLLPLFYILFSSYRIVHLHSPNKYLRLLFCFVGIFKKNVYLHIHGSSLKDAFDQKYSISSWLLKKSLKFVHVLADNQSIYQLAKKYNPRSLLEIDAFLPPIYIENIFTDFKNEIGIIQSKYTISTIGWFSLYKDQDLYGYDILLEALDILLKRGIDVTVVASVNGISNKQVHENFMKNRQELGLEKKFIILNRNFPEIWPLYLISDVFVRATNTDGSALSIKESIWFECPVVTSDCVPRPDKCVLFQNRSSLDLANKIEIVLKSDGISLQDRILKVASKKFDNNLFKDVYHV